MHCVNKDLLPIHLCAGTSVTAGNTTMRSRRGSTGHRDRDEKEEIMSVKL